MKIPLILVPGLLSDETVWASQAASLRDVTEAQIATHAALNTLEGLAELIIARAPPTFTIAGHSMGGRIALEVARRASGRVRGVALLNSACDPLPSGEPGAQERKRRLALLELAQREGMRRMAQQWVQGMVQPARLTDSELVETVVAMFERQTPELLALQTHAMLTRPDARPVLAGLSCPTLVLCGRDDAWSPPARQTEMARTCAVARVVIIEECGHMSTLERSSEVNGALHAWVASIQ